MTSEHSVALVRRLEPQHAPVRFVSAYIKIAIWRGAHITNPPVPIVQQFFLTRHLAVGVEVNPPQMRERQGPYKQIAPPRREFIAMVHRKARGPDRRSPVDQRLL